MDGSRCRCNENRSLDRSRRANGDASARVMWYSEVLCGGSHGVHCIYYWGSQKGVGADEHSLNETRFIA